MDTRILNNANAVALEAAKLIAGMAKDAISERGRFIMAVSGGTTPWEMLRALAKEDVPWENMHIVQVDERVAPAGHPDRNLTHIRESLLDNSPMSEDHIYAMRVESDDLKAAAGQYAETLNKIAGTPPVIDLVHLGLGPDGHTASLVPEDPILNVEDSDVGITGIYQGRQRMTLTYPIINRSRKILWLATGAQKASMLKRLLDSDATIPAGRICLDNALILADLEAAAEINQKSM